ncbi:squalene-associated FAD-dependent desaturase [Streptomyces zhaozhouensis]|uniref:Squalene-associated FAD-dependent desaturase n=1 Tax=Streptomyces zhaozhouensis TaxID=1300267 RepID=A0A286DUR1_9ACTN|nr:hydroxysqualene dehydroxylase HpnE [Streptomyces zhaozhouensis]SOD62409.1 squalene-associated FAD-dependent desaturase [Streptomyces zhaozhouensis]
MSGERRRALVVGGGLAGTTAALVLAARGRRVTLVETRPRLGGLAFSFRRESAVGELTVDNGQHVYLRCCSAYRGLLERVGGARLAPVQRRLEVPVLDADSRRLGRITRNALPVPLHLAGGLARYPHLGLAERASVARAALGLRRLDPDDPALDDRSFADWLRETGQSPGAVAALWDLIGVATLNARAEDTSLALAAKVFRTGLLSGNGAADIGLPRVPLGTLHDELARAALARAGVRVLLATRARSLRAAPGGGWRLGVSSRPGQGHRPDQELAAETVVLAVPQQAAHRLLPPGALPDADRLLAIDTAPILNVHVIYDRPVLDRPFFAAVNSPVQWVFDRTGPSGLDTLPAARGGQYLALSQSAVGAEIQEPAEVLRKRYVPELERLLPRAAQARLLDFFVTRERTATFAPTPGVGRLRPGPVTGAEGLYLAGAWTATGWPATMESAVRSGLTAARAAVQGASTPHRPAKESA